MLGIKVSRSSEVVQSDDFTASEAGTYSVNIGTITNVTQSQSGAFVVAQAGDVLRITVTSVVGVTWVSVYLDSRFYDVFAVRDNGEYFDARYIGKGAQWAPEPVSDTSLQLQYLSTYTDWPAIPLTEDFKYVLNPVVHAQYFGPVRFIDAQTMTVCARIDLDRVHTVLYVHDPVYINYLLVADTGVYAYDRFAEHVADVYVGNVVSADVVRDYDNSQYTMHIATGTEVLQITYTLLHEEVSRVSVPVAAHQVLLPYYVSQLGLHSTDGSLQYADTNVHSIVLSDNHIIVVPDRAQRHIKVVNKNLMAELTMVFGRYGVLSPRVVHDGLYVELTFQDYARQIYFIEFNPNNGDIIYPLTAYRNSNKTNSIFREPGVAFSTQGELTRTPRFEFRDIDAAKPAFLPQTVAPSADVQVPFTVSGVDGLVELSSPEHLNVAYTVNGVPGQYAQSGDTVVATITAPNSAGNYTAYIGIGSQIATVDFDVVPEVIIDGSFAYNSGYAIVSALRVGFTSDHHIQVAHVSPVPAVRIDPTYANLLAVDASVPDITVAVGALGNWQERASVSVPAHDLNGAAPVVSTLANSLLPVAATVQSTVGTDDLYLPIPIDATVAQDALGQSRAVIDAVYRSDQNTGAVYVDMENSLAPIGNEWQVKFFTHQFSVGGIVFAKPQPTEASLYAAAYSAVDSMDQRIHAADFTRFFERVSESWTDDFERRELSWTGFWDVDWQRPVASSPWLYVGEWLRQVAQTVRPYVTEWSKPDPTIVNPWFYDYEHIPHYYPHFYITDWVAFSGEVLLFGSAIKYGTPAAMSYFHHVIDFQYAAGHHYEWSFDFQHTGTLFRYVSLQDFQVAEYSIWQYTGDLQPGTVFSSYAVSAERELQFFFADPEQLEPCMGYFATELEALQDAVLEYEAPDVYAAQTPYDCWYWAVVMPCENMCEACPPVGYIQGG